jgi:TMEM175 potassium channel family protein
MSDPEEVRYIDAKHLKNLVDGIFAIAMTLLVLNLAVPPIIGPVTYMTFRNSLYSLFPTFLHFFLSFFLLALFWGMYHRIFQKIKVVNGKLLWITIFWLSFIVMVPFSTSLTGNYGQFSLAHIFFDLNMLGIALFIYTDLYYADSRNLIYKRKDSVTIKKIKFLTLGFIFTAISALILAISNIQYNETVYLLMVPLYYISNRI